MRLSDVDRLARTLVAQHGLTGWQVALRKSRYTAGCCSYTTRTITLSKQLMWLWDEAEVRDTILHEIAHAVAGHAAGHGPAWKAACIRVGAKPSRCYGQRVAVNVLAQAEAAIR